MEASASLTQWYNSQEAKQETSRFWGSNLFCHLSEDHVRSLRVVYLGRSATGDHVHHGGLNFEEPHLIEELADVGDDLGADVELLLHCHVVDDQVLLAKTTKMMSLRKLGGAVAEGSKALLERK